LTNRFGDFNISPIQVDIYLYMYNLYKKIATHIISEMAVG